VDSCGVQGNRSPDSSGSQGPAPAPTNVQASQLIACGSITVSWQGVPTDTQYELARNTINSPNGRTVLSSNATSPFSDTGVTPNITYYYFVRATSPCGLSGLSTSASGTAATPIEFTTQPQNVSVPLGSSAQFSIAQTGGDTYLWHLNGSPLGDTQNLSGTNTPTLSFASVSPADVGAYTCIVTAACGSNTSEIGYLSLAGFVCPADFNQDGGIDGADIEAFFNAWEQGSSTADVNFDGGIDGSDIEAFFEYWTAGGC